MSAAEPESQGGGQRRLRGIVIVVAAGAVGLLFLPNAARAPLTPAAVPASSSTPTTAPAATPAGTTSPTTTGPAAPATVHVLVANGTGTSGAAASITAVLVSKGFGTLAPTDASGSGFSSSTVYVVNGTPAAAGTAVVMALGLPPSALSAAQPPVADVNGANVVVVLGTDLVHRYPPSPSSGTTSVPTLG